MIDRKAPVTIKIDWVATAMDGTNRHSERVRRAKGSMDVVARARVCMIAPDSLVVLAITIFCRVLVECFGIVRTGGASCV